MSSSPADGDVCRGPPRSPGQPGAAARAPLLLLGCLGDAVAPQLPGVQLGRGQAHGVQRPGGQLLRLRGGLPHPRGSHVSRPVPGVPARVRALRPGTAWVPQPEGRVPPVVHLRSRPSPASSLLSAPCTLSWRPAPCRERAGLGDLQVQRPALHGAGSGTGSHRPGERRPQRGLFPRSLSRRTV